MQIKDNEKDYEIKKGILENIFKTNKVLIYIKTEMQILTYEKYTANLITEEDGT